MFCRGLWDKCFAEDLLVEERYNIFRIIDTYKILFICILLKHHYIPHINNLLLIPDWFMRHMMTCLRRHYWLHDVFTRHHWLSYELNKQIFFSTIYGRLWPYKSKGLSWFIVLNIFMSSTTVVETTNHVWTSMQL